MSGERFVNAYAPEKRWKAAELGHPWRERHTCDHAHEPGRRRIGVWRVRPRDPVLAALCSPWGRKELSEKRQLPSA